MHRSSLLPHPWAGLEDVWDTGTCRACSHSWRPNSNEFGFPILLFLFLLGFRHIPRALFGSIASKFDIKITLERGNCLLSGVLFWLKTIVLEESTRRTKTLKKKERLLFIFALEMFNRNQFSFWKLISMCYDQEKKVMRKILTKEEKEEKFFFSYQLELHPTYVTPPGVFEPRHKKR